MPPHRPEVLRLYLAKITRRTAIDIFRRKTRQKRGASQYEESLSELSECISGGDRTQEAVDSRLLAGGHRGMAERSDATAEGSIFKQILLYGSDQRYRRILRIQSVQGQEHAHAA